MEQILRGGIDKIVGGKPGAFSVMIIVVACLLLVGLMWFMYKNQPSSIIGEICFAIGVLASLAISLFVIMKGIGIVI